MDDFDSFPHTVMAGAIVISAERAHFLRSTRPDLSLSEEIRPRSTLHQRLCVDSEAREATCAEMPAGGASGRGLSCR